MSPSDNSAATRPSREHERDGAAIYRRSFAIIRDETDLAGLDPVEARVAVRVVHSCGMTDIVAALRFTHGAAARARDALRRGGAVFCDSRMVAAGITRARLPANNDVHCTLGGPEVADRAARHGLTRSALAVDEWFALAGEAIGDAVMVIGNAPTALFRLLERLDEGAPHPAAVIGMPVGFVGAAESKNALLAEPDLPAIAVVGRRGGSAMAAAAVNALASDTE